MATLFSNWCFGGSDGPGLKVLFKIFNILLRLVTQICGYPK